MPDLLEELCDVLIREFDLPSLEEGRFVTKDNLIRRYGKLKDFTLPTDPVYKAGTSNEDVEAYHFRRGDREQFDKLRLMNYSGVLVLTSNYFFFVKPEKDHYRVRQFSKEDIEDAANRGKPFGYDKKVRRGEVDNNLRPPEAGYDMIFSYAEHIAETIKKKVEREKAAPLPKNKDNSD